MTDVAVARYLPTGHLLFAQASALQVVPFDAAQASLRGAPVTIVEGVTAVELELVWDPPWSPDMMTEAAKLETGML